MTYLIVKKRKHNTFYDNACFNKKQGKIRNNSGKIVDGEMKTPVALFIHPPDIKQKPDIIGLTTRRAIQTGILKELTLEDTIDYCKKKQFDDEKIKNILTEEDFDTYKQNFINGERKPRKRGRPKMQSTVVDSSKEEKTNDNPGKADFF